MAVPIFVNFRELGSDDWREFKPAGRWTGFGAVPRLMARPFPGRRFPEPIRLDGGGGKPGSWRKWPCAGVYDAEAASVKSLIRRNVNF